MAAIEPKLTDQIFIRQLADAYEKNDTNMFACISNFLSEHLW